MLGRCRETAGFLFSHPCKNPAVRTCTKCGKPICEDHTRGAAALEVSVPGGWPAAGDPVCIGCERRASVAAGRVESRGDDPYFFAWGFYPSYHSASTWVEGDAAAFTAGASSSELPPDEEWEKDWDAS